MDLSDYFSAVGGAIEFLVAFGSLIGFFGLIGGFLLLVAGPRYQKKLGVKIVIISFILVGICGFSTGIKYFRF